MANSTRSPHTLFPTRPAAGLVQEPPRQMPSAAAEREWDQEPPSKEKSSPVRESSGLKAAASSRRLCCPVPPRPPAPHPAPQLTSRRQRLQAWAGTHGGGPVIVEYACCFLHLGVRLRPPGPAPASVSMPEPLAAPSNASCMQRRSRRSCCLGRSLLSHVPRPGRQLWPGLPRAPPPPTLAAWTAARI